jgi:hypothetical protein
MRLRCRRCGDWCGDRVTTATPRLRGETPYDRWCVPCMKHATAPRTFYRLERIGPYLFRFRPVIEVIPGQAAR